jgi:Transposase DDE domain
MTHRRDSQIFRELTSVIPRGRVRRRARELGVVKRRRKVDVVALVNSLVLGFDGGKERTIAGLRRAYERSTGTTLAPSAFYDRLTPELGQLLRELTDDALTNLDRAGTRMQLALKTFERVFVADGSLVRFHDSLEADYPSVWTNHMKASGKLHVVMDAAGRIPRHADLVPGCRHDLNVIRVGPWLNGGLLLVDLAYYQGDLFKAIHEEGGFVLCRLKKHARFRIVSSENGSLDGMTIKHATRLMHGKSFDVQVDYVYRRIRQRDFAYRHVEMRIAAIWREDLGVHRLYVTNAPASMLALEQVPAVYALRWEIELLFRELKTLYRIEQMPSGRRGATECLLYAALLALALSRRLQKLVTGAEGSALNPNPPERWSCIFCVLARDLLELSLLPRRHRLALGNRLVGLLRHEARDPNRKRLLLPARAQLATFATSVAPA